MKTKWMLGALLLAALLATAGASLANGTSDEVPATTKTTTATTTPNGPGGGVGTLPYCPVECREGGDDVGSLPCQLCPEPIGRGPSSPADLGKP